ncbi:MAG: hypothetical protein DRJ42_11665 [Deltaproteobacteria bacterium]|nr:MAG: hypothetical protein DRJ42_11665 [Deltaproteobacteria bacterium]
MGSFATLPFQEQLARIEAASAYGEEDLTPLLREAGALPDAEPLARLVVVLAESGRMTESLLERLVQIAEHLPDPALQHLLAQTGSGELVDATLRKLVERALNRWPVERISALALLSRWLRQRFPDAYRSFVGSALERTGDGPLDARWLLFVSGHRLVQLSGQAAWKPLVTETVAKAVDALARAPKSISQANAESLLAKRVYADPGHFFFELLQNAEDAGASRWRAVVGPDGVTVEHDGQPFSFHDLVGVLSIGQTTKRAEQIGFFGVGFKSIYEVCERPRVHSGVFDFEIAHVSIPRSLAVRPESSQDEQDGQTVLILPYSADVNADDLYDRARAFPPETLLTLPNVRSIEILKGTTEAWSWQEEWDGDVATLRRNGTTETRRYLCVQRRFSFSGKREDGRTHSSPVLVAVALDDAGQPSPIDGPTIYAFLPTAEHTGLRCMVHARFDVTLDRERLEHDSVWNQELLREAGRGLAQAIKSLATSGRSPLAVLSSPTELAPATRPFAEALVAELRDYPCLPGADGTSLRPTEARVVAAHLSAPLAGLDLGGGSRALAQLSAREQAVAVSLGATEFTGADLVTFARGSLREGAPPPAWFCDAVLGALGDSDAPDRDIRALPMVVDASGNLVRPDRAMAAETTWANLYVSIKPVVERRLVDSLPASLRSRLSIPPYDPATLIDDLRDPALAARLLAREDALLGAIGTLPRADRTRLSAVPILRTTAGVRRSIDNGLRRLEPDLHSLAAHLADKVPLLAGDLAERFGPLVTEWVPPLGLAELADMLPKTWPSDGAPWSDNGAEAVLDLLDRAAGTLGQNLVRSFAAAAIFRDKHGVRRRLVGPDRALIAEDEELPQMLPDWPWLAQRDRPFIGAANVPWTHVGPVVDGLVKAATAPAEAHSIRDDHWALVIAWITRHADQLSTRSIDQLVAAPVWLDATGQRRTLDTLRRPGGPDHVEAFFRAMGSRFEAHGVSEALSMALRVADKLASSTVRTVIQDLVSHASEVSVPPTVLADLLNEATDELSTADLRRVLRLPLFRDGSGRARPLTTWAEADALACHRPGTMRPILRGGTFPLLSEDDEKLFAKFLHIAGPPPATAVDLVRCVQVDESLLGNPRAIREVLHQSSDDLDEHARASLATLPIFENENGEARRITELFIGRELRACLTDTEIEALQPGPLLLEASQEALVARLGLSPRPLSEFVAQNMLSELEADQPLETQPAPWNSRPSLVRLLELVQRAGIDPRSAPLAVDAQKRLAIGPLATANPATRTLVARLPAVGRLADSEWSGLVPDTAAALVLTSLSHRQVANALQVACPEELPIAGHPVIADLGALYEWLRENRESLDQDEDALAALASAAVLPSQKQTLRAPRDLVLDPSLPDLGLGWGISAEVPTDIATWLAKSIELDRRTRRVVIEYLLEGVQTAARDDDKARAGELMGFLARALGAGEVTPGELEERVRYSKVRARLRVPVAEHRWEKPKRAWLAHEDDAAQVEVFCSEAPPRIVFGPIDAPSRALLVACGATEELSDKIVAGCLSGELIRPGDAARRSLSRYVLTRVLEQPRLRHDWGLDETPWVPDQLGKLAKPRDLLWPDGLARALFGASPDRFPAGDVVRDLPDEAGAALGFQLAANLDLADAAQFAGEREGTAALLDWLDGGLRDGRFRAPQVRASFRQRLLLRDDEGVLRPPAELAIDGAHALFGTRRGDFSEGERLPNLTRALGIPREPSAEMVLSFLEDVSAQGSEDPRELGEVLPRCLEELGQAVDDGAGLRLPEGVLVAGLCDGAVVLARLSDARVRMFEPAALAESLPPIALQTLVELLPSAGLGTGLANLLLASGARDLWCDFEVGEVLPGPEQPAFLEAANELQRGLFRALGDRVDLGVRVVEPLSVAGTLPETLTSSGSRESDTLFTTDVDAVIHDGILWLTPASVERPELLAPALEREPSRRAAMARWLAKREWASLPKRLRDKNHKMARDAGGGIFDRVRSFFRREPSQPRVVPERAPVSPPTETPAERRAGNRERDKTFDEGLFRPQSELRPQLASSEGWLARRTRQPDFGFAFTPTHLSTPWLYAPKLITIEFDRRGQSWRSARLDRPPPTTPAGMVVFRGRLPRGEAVLPVPMFGTVEQLSVDGQAVLPAPGPSGGHLLRLNEPGDVRLRVALGRVPDLERAEPSPIGDALAPFVPNDELPDEVLDFVGDLDADSPPITRALSIRDFVRKRYRYDPSYLEDPGVARWLTRVAKGRANGHIAALHAGRDGKHLGAGVCYELNTLTCELLRRAGVPAAVATGWVLDGGALSEPDHLWCVALLRDARGTSLWVPIDASSTRTGRPLRVPKRPPGRFRAPRDGRAKAPKPPKLNIGSGTRTGRSQSRRPGRSRKSKPRVPRAELLRVIRHLEKLAGHALDDNERAKVERALEDPKAAAKLLGRLAR